MDEVGRGPLAGPVVTCCIIMPYDNMIDGVYDSKKVTAKKRDELYDLILNSIQQILTEPLCGSHTWSVQ